MEAKGIRLSILDSEENIMSRIELINASCADQEVDAVVNAANDRT